MTSDASWLESMPAVYDRCLGPVLFAPFAPILAAAVADLAPRRVLELAAGTGIATAALVAALPAADVTATDLNPAMTMLGAQRVPGATWIAADAQHLQFGDASFDVVASQFGVMFFPDKAAAFAETARVLEPGGATVFAVWDRVEASAFPAALVDSLAVVLPDDPPGFVVRTPHGYSDPAEIEADLAAGGLHLETIERLVVQARAPSARTLAEGFCLGTPLRFELEKRGSLELFTEAIARDMTTRLGSGEIDGELAAFLVAARSST
jgi:SAM-dependent methyltransferase